MPLGATAHGTMRIVAMVLGAMAIGAVALACTAARSIALFERALTGIPSHHRAAIPLTHPGMRSALWRIALKYDYDLIE